MTALFVYTAKVFECNGHYYTNNLPSKIWQDRYLKIFDRVSVYARRIVVSECREALSECEGVDFHLTDLGVNRKDLIFKTNAIYREIYRLALKVDFIVARMGFFGVLAVKAARALGKPYVCEVVGSSWDDLWNYSLSGKIAACWLQPQVKRAVAQAHYAVYVTNEYLQKEYPCNGRTIGISNVILPPHVDEILVNRLNRIQSRKSNDPIILGTAAGIDVPYKGQRFVIEALKILNEKGVNCEYHLAGNGDRSVLYNYARECGVGDQVKFVGTLSHEKMHEYYDCLDIYIQPSLQEGLPRAMIEAMGRGLPALGAKTAGIPELIDVDCVCRRKNVEDIVHGIERLINHPALMTETAIRNFKKSFEYEKDILEERWFQFYSAAIHNR